METAVVARSNSVLTLNIKLYTHTQPITNNPKDGVEENNISVILSVKNPRFDTWTIDCVDLANMDGIFLRAGRGKVFEGIFRALAEHGINPRHVHGWTNWGIQKSSLRQVLNSYEQTGSVPAMRDYMPQNVRTTRKRSTNARPEPGHLLGDPDGAG